MQTAIVIGSTGLVGSAVEAELKRVGLDVTCRKRDTSEILEADYVFDCSGESRTYMHDREPEAGFTNSVGLALKNVLANRAHKRYVYISSSRVYPGRDGSSATHPVNPYVLLNQVCAKAKLDRYARNKLLSECIVLTELPSTGSIIRICGVVGDKMYKGPVFDLRTRPQQLRITLDSRLQLLHSVDLAHHVVKYATSSQTCNIVNLGATTTPDLYTIAKILKINVVQEYATSCEVSTNCCHVIDSIKPTNVFSNLPTTEESVKKLL